MHLLSQYSLLCGGICEIRAEPSLSCTDSQQRLDAATPVLKDDVLTSASLTCHSQGGYGPVDKKMVGPLFDLFSHTFSLQHLRFHHHCIAMSANYTIAGFGECSLDTCGIQQSLFGYRPSLAASGVFIALFGISLATHLAQGFQSRKWTFASLVAFGCAIEIVGYGGRIIMNGDPWSFAGFMLQIGMVISSYTPAVYSLLTTILKCASR